MGADISFQDLQAKMQQMRPGTMLIPNANKSFHIRNVKYIAANNPGIEYNEDLLYLYATLKKLNPNPNSKITAPHVREWRTKVEVKVSTEHDCFVIKDPSVSQQPR